ncbi:MAG TPA: sigma-54 dependent transcriptional regulator [Syntrophobacteraceae bacterium]|nr:sigma-54 dependent transcriptional regulator [Syntrophobacteraceae bacterium]
MNVLVVETDSNDARKVSLFLRAQGHLCFLTDSARSAKSLLKKESPGLVLLHLNGLSAAHTLDFLETARSMEPPAPVIVLTTKPRLEDAVESVKNGAYDFWTKPFAPERLSKVIEHIEATRERSAQQWAPHTGDDPIITHDPGLGSIKALARKIASSNATVFIQGESGTGKELFARYIHSQSARKVKPFVALNCAALPETLLESELFGYEKGAFTGAIRNREGKFELAHTGTLLLDEVSEIPLHLQAKLLRVLQESEVDRLGGRYPVRVDVRIIATTNVRIEDRVKEAKFRKDLYYRLNVIPLRIPPLRERSGDIVTLAEFFLAEYSVENGFTTRSFSPEALKRLVDYSWPGNVRELQNVVQRAVLICETSVVSQDCVILDTGIEQQASQASGFSLMPLCEVEKIMIEKALGTVEGNRTRAAEILGISVRTLRNKLAEYRQGSEQ